MNNTRGGMKKEGDKSGKEPWLSARLACDQLVDEHDGIDRPEYNVTTYTRSVPPLNLLRVSSLAPVASYHFYLCVRVVVFSFTLGTRLRHVFIRKSVFFFSRLSLHFSLSFLIAFFFLLSISFPCFLGLHLRFYLVPIFHPFVII